MNSWTLMVRRRPQVPQDDGVYWYIFKTNSILFPYLPIFYQQIETTTFLWYVHSKIVDSVDFKREYPEYFKENFRLMMGMIGFTVGFIGFLLHNVVDCIEEPILERSLGYGWQPFEHLIGTIWRSSSSELWVILSCSTLIDWVRLRRKHCISVVMANWHWNNISWCIISYNCLFSTFGRWIGYPGADCVLKWDLNSTYL